MLENSLSWGQVDKNEEEKTTRRCKRIENVKFSKEELEFAAEFIESLEYGNNYFNNPEIKEIEVFSILRNLFDRNDGPNIKYLTGICEYTNNYDIESDIADYFEAFGDLDFEYKESIGSKELEEFLKAMNSNLIQFLVDQRWYPRLYDRSEIVGYDSILDVLNNSLSSLIEILSDEYLVSNFNIDYLKFNTIKKDFISIYKSKQFLEDTVTQNRIDVLYTYEDKSGFKNDVRKIINYYNNLISNESYNRDEIMDNFSKEIIIMLNGKNNFVIPNRNYDYNTYEFKSIINNEIYSIIEGIIDINNSLLSNLA